MAVPCVPPPAPAAPSLPLGVTAAAPVHIFAMPPVVPPADAPAPPYYQLHYSSIPLPQPPLLLRHPQLAGVPSAPLPLRGALTVTAVAATMPPIAQPARDYPPCSAAVAEVAAMVTLPAASATTRLHQLLLLWPSPLLHQHQLLIFTLLLLTLQNCRCRSKCSHMSLCINPLHGVVNGWGFAAPRSLFLGLCPLYFCFLSCTGGVGVLPAFLAGCSLLTCLVFDVGLRGS